MGDGEWIIQRCTQEWSLTELQYQDWPGYCEHLMTLAGAIKALGECARRWPDEEFRAHRVVNAV